MYKERVKPGINPIWTIPVWAVSIYALSILWGIIQILIGFFQPYVMQIFLFAGTLAFGWYLVSKCMTEYEITVSPRYITVTRFLGRKTRPVITIRSQNIIAAADSKKDIKTHKISKSENFIRAFQKGNKIYVVYNHDNEKRLLKMKLSGLNANQLTDKFKKEGI